MKMNKLQRFAEMKEMPNVIQFGYRDVENIGLHPLRGKWKKDFFKNENPIVLELGCGKGEYTIALARKNPNINYIGIDLKGARFWRGAKTALEENLTNVTFIRTQIELVDLLFNENEVNEIWITFPDPQIKYTRTKHRLTNAEFLKKYYHILKPEGVVNLKTDSEFMHGYTLGLLHGAGHDVLYAHHDIYKNPQTPIEVTSTQTFYESQYLEKGKAITYIKFRIRYT
ncbi:MAG: tRNA (guanosine(46)-N7)-methyltransferase TrmB [Lutibacter sp.]|nr:tRNA (guanosine(46)-N7)-methyltransferase TrmB [Lutibacter sp.]